MKRRAFRKCTELLEKIIKEELFTCEAVVGIWPANSVMDDVLIYKDLKSKEEARFHFIRRQQTLLDQPQYCLSDYIAPFFEKNRLPWCLSQLARS